MLTRGWVCSSRAEVSKALRTWILGVYIFSSKPGIPREVPSFDFDCGLFFFEIKEWWKSWWKICLFCYRKSHNYINVSYKKWGRYQSSDCMTPSRISIFVRYLPRPDQWLGLVNNWYIGTCSMSWRDRQRSDRISLGIFEGMDFKLQIYFPIKFLCILFY